jgi:hypothetical protein
MVLYYYKKEQPRGSADPTQLLGLMPLNQDTAMVDLGAVQQAPPPFKNASSCGVCGCSFSALRRQHHCRCCGQSLCGKCSTQSIVIPKMGFNAPVRVDDKCYAACRKENNAWLIHVPAMSTGKRMSTFLLGNKTGLDAKSMKQDDDQNKFSLPDKTYPHMFALKSKDRELWLYAETSQQREKWIEELDKAKNRTQEHGKEQGQLKKQWEIEFKSVELLNKIGSGSFGDVFQGKLWGTDVAVKTLKTEDLDWDTIMEDLRVEIQILSQLRHPNVVLYIGASTSPPDVCIVTEW